MYSKLLLDKSSWNWKISNGNYRWGFFCHGNCPIDPTSIDTRTASTDKPVPTKISSVQHESFCINIYDSQITKIKKKIFYYSPITVLQHKNVAIIHKKTVPHLYVNFFISNQEVINKVLEHLSQHLSQEIELNQVKVLPYDSVRLTSKVQSSDFSLTN
jgi:hypothetical protein